MLKPVELETDEGRNIRETLVVASQGDVVSLQRLIDSPAIHFAVRLLLRGAGA